MDKRIIEVKIASLKPHPLNEEIYPVDSDAAIDDLIDSIKTMGVLESLLITAGNVIVSGHRRHRAASAAGLNVVPATILSDSSGNPISDDLHIESVLITANKNREKTNEQKTREFMHLKRIEAERAKRRQVELAGTRPNSGDLPENFPEGKAIKTGDARDLAAAALGVSGKSMEKAEQVVNKIDELKAAGRSGEAEAIRSALNKNFSSGYKMVRKPRVTTKNVSPKRWAIGNLVGCCVSTIAMIDKKDPNAKKALEQIIRYAQNYLEEINSNV